MFRRDDLLVVQERAGARPSYVYQAKYWATRMLSMKCRLGTLKLA
jgi:hypothetical protein